VEETVEEPVIEESIVEKEPAEEPAPESAPESAPEEEEVIEEYFLYSNYAIKAELSPSTQPVGRFCVAKYIQERNRLEIRLDNPERGQKDIKLRLGNTVF